MICPHCGHENAEGRKYCRGCAKALASEPVAAKSTPPTHDQPAHSTVADSTVVDPPAIKILDPFAEDSSPAPPSAVSKQVIVIAALLAIVIGGVVFWFMHKRDRDREAQAAQAESALNNVAYHPIAESPENRQHLLAALRLIVAQQEARAADDPDDLNVCAVNLFGNDELGRHVRESHYIIDQQCQPRTAEGRAIRNGFTVTATPKSEDNPAGAPTYCVDQTKVIRRYTEANEVNDATSVQHLTCPLDGQPTE
jgi:hypothetical protein